MSHGYSFFLIKPDAVRRSLCGRIIARLEQAGFAVTGLKRVGKARLAVVLAHYQEHAGRTYFNDLVQTLAWRPTIAGTVRYAARPEDTVARLRALVGPYDDPPYGTLRHEFAVSARENSVHSADSPEAAARAAALWFGDDVF
jgi:nucleoside-diphosphate kinase